MTRVQATNVSDTEPIVHHNVEENEYDVEGAVQYLSNHSIYEAYKTQGINVLDYISQEELDTLLAEDQLRANGSNKIVTVQNDGEFVYKDIYLDSRWANIAKQTGVVALEIISPGMVHPISIAVAGYDISNGVIIRVKTRIQGSELEHTRNYSFVSIRSQ